MEIEPKTYREHAGKDLKVNHRNKVGMVASAFVMIGGVSGLLSIGLLVFKGGAALQMLNSHEIRLNGLEVKGSENAREYIREDKQREEDFGRRIARLEDLLAAVPRIEVKLDGLKEALEKHERKQEENRGQVR